jgi:hypothetical protein
MKSAILNVNACGRWWVGISTLHASFTAMSYQLINPLGGVLSKDDYLGVVAAGDINYLVWEPESIEVRLY